MSRRSPLVVVVCVLLLACACADEDLRAVVVATEAVVTVVTTPAPAATPKVLTALTKTKDGTVVERTPVPGAAPPRLPPPRVPQFSGLWLVNLGSGAVHRLHDSADGVLPRSEWVGAASFERDGSVRLNPVREGASTEYFSAAGVPLPSPQGGAEQREWRCEQPDYQVPRVRIAGREYVANCGAFSPDGLLMTWRGRRSANDITTPLPVYLLDVASGVSQRLPLESRGGAGDGFWTDRWSASGEFVILIWFGDEVAYLRDRAGNVRLVGRHAQLFGAELAMSWSPREEAYLSPGLEGVPFAEWPASGRRVEFAGATWPLAFDLTGTFVSWIEGTRVSNNPEDEPGERMHPATVVATVDAGEVVARWLGAQATNIRVPLRGVTSFEGRPVGLMERDDRTPQPSGRLTPDSLWNTTTIVHHPLLAAPLELARAGGATWSRDALQVAFARADFSERVFEATASTGRAFTIDRSWVVEVLDVRTGARREVARVPNTDGPPVLEWSPVGDALLVSFPRPSGL